MPSLKSASYTTSLKELYDKINTLPASELKYYLFLLLDAIKNSKASQKNDILQETFLFCDTASDYLANKSSSDEKYVRALHDSLQNLIEKSALHSYSNKVEDGFVTALGLCCGLLFSAVLGAAGAIRGLFIRPNILKGAIEGFSIGFGLGMLLGTRLPEKWIIREDKRKLKKAINGIAESLAVFTTNKSSSFQDRVEKHTQQIKALFTEQNPDLSPNELDEAFNEFLKKANNYIEICSRPIHLLSEHSEGFMGHHSYIKFKLFGEKHVLELSNPNTEFETIPSQKEIRKVSGQQLIEMMTFNEKLSETHILDSLSYMLNKYRAGEADCVTHLDKLLTVTTQSPSNIRRINEQTDNAYSAYLIGKGFEYLSAFAHHDVLSTHQEFNNYYIKTSSYDPEPLPKGMSRSPLIITSSGGGGHLSAAHGIVEYLKKQYKDVRLASHYPVKPQSDAQPTYEKLKIAMSWMHEKSISSVIKHICHHYTNYPVIPQKKQIDQEVNILKSKNDPTKPRSYVDMLLDVCEMGYESVAINNTLAKNEDIHSLRKLFLFKQDAEDLNYHRIYNYFIDMLKKAALNKTPYTEIINTQVLGTQALCNAIIDYNNWLESSEQLQDYPKPVIHQYMTDLPTDGARHYCEGLKELTTQQRSHIKLYACELHTQFLMNNLPLSNSFAGLYRIDAKENPMVRPNFNNSQTSLHDKWGVDTTIAYADYRITKIEKDSTYQLNKENGPAIIPIKANQPIASIMLGSQGSIDTISYVETLLNSHYEKIFIFGGLNHNLYPPLQGLMAKYKDLKDKIVCLGNQDDGVIQPIMTRSNVVITRAGGLSTMEQLKMSHNQNQKIYIHHADNSQDKLDSGFSWEDSNGDKLAQHAEAEGYKVIKTSPNRFAKEIEVQMQLKNFYRKVKTENFNHTLFANTLNRESLPMHATIFKPLMSV